MKCGIVARNYGCLHPSKRRLNNAYLGSPRERTRCVYALYNTTTEPRLQSPATSKTRAARSYATATVPLHWCSQSRPIATTAETSLARDACSVTPRQPSFPKWPLIGRPTIVKHHDSASVLSSAHRAAPEQRRPLMRIPMHQQRTLPGMSGSPGEW